MTERAAPSSLSLHDAEYRVTALSRADGEELAALRRLTYLASPSFQWNDPATLDWSDVDDAGVVLGVRTRDGRLVASNRATTRTDQRAVETVLEYATDAAPQRFPILVCGRTATHPDHARHGLTALTRHAILVHARRLGLAGLIAVVYANAPRLGSMRSCGYAFFPCPRYWDREAKPLAEPLIIAMAATGFDQALAQVEQVSAPLFARSRFDEAGIAAAFDRDVQRHGRMTGSGAGSLEV